ncbi:MAG: TolC family protein [Myxococcota bacterium]
MKVTHRIRFLLPLLALGASTPALAESLTPEEALAKAAARSPELRAALYDLKAAGFAIDAADRARDAVLSGSVHATHGQTDSVDASLGVKTTSRIGTVIDVGADASFDGVPTSSATFGIDVRQPLLQGGGEDAVLAQLNQARLEKSASEADRDRAASQLAASVLDAYWEVWFAAKALAVEKDALALTEQQVADLTKKVEVLKTSPAIDLLKLSSEAASQRGQVAQAEADLEAAQISLARLVGSPLGAATELATVADPSAPPAIDPLDTLTAMATAESYELRAQRLSIEAEKVGVRAAVDQAQPRLDLVGSLKAGALWDDNFSGFSLSGGRPGIIAMVGLEGELPFGRSRDDANLDGARARLASAEARYQSSLDDVAESVARARRQLIQAETALRIASETSAIAQKLADTEAKKLALGTSVLTDLVIAQQSARQAELQRLRAAADIETKRIALEALTGGLLPRVAALAPALTNTTVPSEL